MRDEIENFNPDPDAPVAIDTIIPAQGRISMGGNYARRLLDNELDVGALRPYIDGKNRTFITRNNIGYNRKTQKIVTIPKAIQTQNDTNATLRILDWIQLDEAVIKEAKPRLKAARDLEEMGLIYALPNGIAKTVMQFQQQSDISPAIISMDGLRQSESDRPVWSTINFPIPIIHKDFQFGLREVLASRTGYSPLDMSTAELAGRRVAEAVEQLTLGTTNSLFGGGAASYSFGGGTIQGYMNFSGRLTSTITLPTALGWTPDTTLANILTMKTLSQQSNHFGPWMLYFGLGWDKYMDNDYKPTYNSTSLRQRIMQVDGILGAKTLDYIPDYSLLLVQMTTDVVRMVQGMGITTIQWESHGGMQLNFKVLCVKIPQIRTTLNGSTGLVHGNG